MQGNIYYYNVAPLLSPPLYLTWRNLASLPNYTLFKPSKPLFCATLITRGKI